MHGAKNSDKISLFFFFVSLSMFWQYTNQFRLITQKAVRPVKENHKTCGSCVCNNPSNEFALW